MWLAWHGIWPRTNVLHKLRFWPEDGSRRNIKGIKLQKAVTIHAEGDKRLHHCNDITCNCNLAKCSPPLDTVCSDRTKWMQSVASIRCTSETEPWRTAQYETTCLYSGFYWSEGSKVHCKQTKESKQFPYRWPQLPRVASDTTCSTYSLWKWATETKLRFQSHTGCYTYHQIRKSRVYLRTSWAWRPINSYRPRLPLNKWRKAFNAVAERCCFDITSNWTDIQAELCE